jgi:hypothetical protein
MVIDDINITLFAESYFGAQSQKTISIKVIPSDSGRGGKLNWKAIFGIFTTIALSILIVMSILTGGTETSDNPSGKELSKLKQQVICLKQTATNAPKFSEAVIREIEIVELLIDGFGEKTTSENLEYASDKVHNLEKKLEQFGVSTEGCTW